MTSAETAYLFRHALLRDAARQLQLPGDRAGLHALAFALIETLAGGPPRNAESGEAGIHVYVRHSCDAFAIELAEHARRAQDAADARPAETMQAAERLYTFRAAEYSERNFGFLEAARLWARLATLEHGRDAIDSLRRAGYALHKISRPAEATQYYLEALKLCESENLPGEAASVQCNLAQLHNEVGALDSSERVAREALATLGVTNDRRLEGMVVGNLADVFRKTGRVALAEEFLLRAVEIHRNVGHKLAEGAALSNLGSLCRTTGRLELSEDFFQRSLAILREIGDVRYEGGVLSALAILYEQTNRAELAELTYRRALAIHRRTGSRRLEGLVLGNLAGLYRDAGKMELAEDLYFQALAIAEETADRRNHANTLAGIANLYCDTGRLELAQRTYERAVELLRASGDKDAHAVALGNLAGLYRDLGHVQKSAAAFDEAIASLRNMNDRHLSAALTCDYCLTLLILDQHDSARSQWRQAVSELTALGDEGERQRRTIDMREACAKAGVPPFDVDESTPAATG